MESIEALDDVAIQSAAYCKKTKSPQHEFIWVRFQNTNHPNAWNYMVVDRNKENGSVWDADILPSVQQSASVSALDEFRISTDGNLNKLLKRCNLAPCSTIETVAFVPGNNLPFYLLVALALSTARLRDRYHIFHANCYWFAGMIWECMIRMYPDASHEVVQRGVRGKLGNLFAHDTNEAELKDTLDFVQDVLQEIGLDVAELVRKGTTRRESFTIEPTRSMISQFRRRILNIQNTNPTPPLAPIEPGDRDKPAVGIHMDHREISVPKLSESKPPVRAHPTPLTQAPQARRSEETSKVEWPLQETVAAVVPSGTAALLMLDSSSQFLARRSRYQTLHPLHSRNKAVQLSSASESPRIPQGIIDYSPREMGNPAFPSSVYIANRGLTRANDLPPVKAPFMKD